MPLLPRVDPKIDKRPPGARFERIPDGEKMQIRAASLRAVALAKQWRIGRENDASVEVNNTVTEIDFVVAHLCRNLNLRALLTCSDLDFISEHTAIQKNIDRRLLFLSADVPLRFARSGAKVS